MTESRGPARRDAAHDARRAGLLDIDPATTFDRFTRLAKHLCATPIALISSGDSEQQILESAQGLTEPWARAREMPLVNALCHHIASSGLPLVVSNAQVHDVTRNSREIRELGPIACVGVPLRTPDGKLTGTLCVLDTARRDWSEDDVQRLDDLAEGVMAEIAARHYRKKLEDAAAALLEREVQNTEILESIDEAYYELDRELRFVYINSTAERLWKRRREELLGQTVLAAFPEWAGTETYKAHEEAMAAGQRRRIETQSGLLGVPVEINLHPGPSGMSVYLRDVSHRRRMEEQLRERDEALTLAERSAGIGVWDVDLSTGLARGTPQYFRLMGLEPTSDAVPIEVFRALIGPEDRVRLVEGFQKAIASGRDSYEIEYRIVRPDGQPRWIFGRGRLLRTVGGKPFRYSGVDIDITERKAAEAALAESENRYRALVENANDLVTTLDLELRFTSANPAVERLLGYSAQDLLGQPLSRYLPQGTDFDPSELRRKLATGEPAKFEIEVIGAAGQHFTLELNSRLAFDGSGKPSSIHAIARDITERKHAEARQFLLIRELQHRTKNMLAVVQAIVTNTLARGDSIESASEAIVGRLHALARAQDFVASGAAGGAPLRELIEAEVASFGTRVAIDGPAIYADIAFAQMFALVVHELSTNAMKHGSLSHPGGRVRVRWKIEGSGSNARFQFSWVERDGPRVAPPVHSGFGTRLIAHALATKPRTTFGPRGFEYRVRVPLSAVIRPGEGEAPLGRANYAVADAAKVD